MTNPAPASPQLQSGFVANQAVQKTLKDMQADIQKMRQQGLDPTTINNRVQSYAGVIQGEQAGVNAQAQIVQSLSAIMPTDELISMAQAPNAQLGFKVAVLDYEGKQATTSISQAQARAATSLGMQVLQAAGIDRNALTDNSATSKIAALGADATTQQTLLGLLQTEESTTNTAINNQAQLNHAMGILGQHGITSSNVADRVAEVGKIFQQDDNANWQADLGAVNNYIGTLTSGINVGTARAQRTSQEAAASSAWSTATLTNINNYMQMAGMAISAVGLGWLASKAFGWAAKQPWAANHPWIQQMADITAAIAKPIESSVTGAIRSGDAWAHTADPQDVAAIAASSARATATPGPVAGDGDASLVAGRSASDTTSRGRAPLGAVLNPPPPDQPASLTRTSTQTIVPAQGAQPRTIVPAHAPGQ